MYLPSKLWLWFRIWDTFRSITTPNTLFRDLKFGHMETSLVCKWFSIWMGSEIWTKVRISNDKSARWQLYCTYKPSLKIFGFQMSPDFEWSVFRFHYTILFCPPHLILFSVRLSVYLSWKLKSLRFLHTVRARIPNVFGFWMVECVGLVVLTIGKQNWLA